MSDHEEEIPIGYEDGEWSIVVLSGAMAGIVAWGLRGAVIGIALAAWCAWSRARRARRARVTIRDRRVAREELEARRAAVHEAGHVLAAWCSTGVVRVNEAVLHAEGGNVTISYRIDALWAQLVGSLAGMAADILAQQRSGRSAR